MSDDTQTAKATHEPRPVRQEAGDPRDGIDPHTREIIDLAKDMAREAYQRGFDRGWEAGARRMLTDRLQDRFGPISDAARNRVKNANTLELLDFSWRLRDAAALDDVFA